MLGRVCLSVLIMVFIVSNNVVIPTCGANLCGEWCYIVFR